MRRLTTAVLATALVLAACGSASSPALTVNGVETSVDDVTVEFEAILDSEEYQTLLAAGAPDVEIKGDGAATLSTDLGAQLLSRRVIFALITAEVAARDIEVSDFHVQSATTDLESQFGAGDPAVGQAVLDAFPDDYAAYLIDSSADAAALLEELSEGEVGPTGAEEFFEANTEQFQQLCTSHILVGTEAAATDLLAQLDDGADFAELAGANSTDTGSAANGGDLGCVARGTFVPEFEAAALAATPGGVTEPVETEFGFHLILVNELITPTFEEAQAEVLARLQADSQTGLSDWLNEALLEADVNVNPRYGSWSAELTSVVPPEGPQPPLVEEEAPPETAPQG